MNKPLCHRVCNVLALLMAVLVLPSTALAADGVAVLTVNNASAEWKPLVDYEALLLRIAPPDGLVREVRFGAGEVPVVVFDGGGKWPDGVYIYELVVAPRLGEQLEQELLAARERDDDEEVWRLQKQVTGPLLQSGAFKVVGGVGVPNGGAAEVRGPRAVSSPAVKGISAPDQVLGDDLIVSSSACLGVGCQNNEDFALDTIRLKIKDSVVRVKFEDTSTGGPPTRDWQMTVNDQSTGADYFRIEDVTGPTTKPFTILGGALDNSIWIDDTSEVGLRTSTPSTELHLSSPNLPELRLEQNTTGGLPAQTWDVQGDHLAFAVQDVSGNKTPFKIAPGAPNDSVTVSANGRVGFGSPTAIDFEKFAVVGAAPGDALMKVMNTSTNGFSGIEFRDNLGGAHFFFGVDNAGQSTRLNSFNNFPFRFLTNTKERITIATGGNVGVRCSTPLSHFVIASTDAASGCVNPSSSINAGSAQFTTASSRTFKENLAAVDVPDLLAKVAAIDVYRFDFINGPKDRLGLMAEDFYSIFGRGSDKYLDGGEVQMALWLAVRELNSRNESLRADNRVLEERLATLETKLEALLAARHD